MDQHRAAVLGSPIAHSLSPVLHRTAYDGLGLAGWRYDALEVATSEELRPVVERLSSQPGTWAGLSLTMPLKRLVQPMLASVSEPARLTGSVNTVLPGDAGPTGDNTDVEGLSRALDDAGVATRVTGRAVVVGAGGTATSAVAALAGRGVGELEVVVRDPSRATEVVRVGEELGVAVRVMAWAAAPAVLRGAEVVVSTVPSSAHDALASAVREARDVGGVLLDVTYHPWPSAVATSWERAGGRAEAGLAMLVHQAAAQVRLMTGQAPDVRAMLAAGRSALATGTR